jgi:hypothetical protein
VTDQGIVCQWHGLQSLVRLGAARKFYRKIQRMEKAICESQQRPTDAPVGEPNRDDNSSNDRLEGFGEMRSSVRLRHYHSASDEDYVTVPLRLNFGGIFQSVQPRQPEICFSDDGFLNSAGSSFPWLEIRPAESILLVIRSLQAF